MKRFRALSLVFVPVLASMAQADITYSVKADPTEKKLLVTIEIPSVKDSVQVEMPNWAPGAYMLVDSWKNVSDLKCLDGKGKDATIEKPNDYTWKLSGGNGRFTITYSIPNSPVDGAMHYSGPSTYLYVVDRKKERCLLSITGTDEKWPVAVGLDEVKGKPNNYIAKDYDVLADNPVTMGAFELDTYEYGGKPHFIVYRGAAKNQVDKDRVKAACQTITEVECKFWGAQPYSKYVWHFSVREGLDGGGGLEHLSSTQISMASGAGPGVIRVFSHEFFHLWNVKRVRSFPLGPFDYTQLPKTGALWFLEGVTDYYANVLLARAGWDSEADFYGELMNNVNGVRANPARLEVSPYDSSLRVGEAANGRGNSNGYRVSYYNTGWLCGLVLDMEIRSKSGGKHSLDDVCRALWQICKEDKPGFAEDEIRKQCIKFGGESLGDFYDRVIMKPGELPVEEALATMGLEIKEVDEPTLVWPFGWVSDREKGGARVRRVEDSAKNELQEGDIIMEINGKPTSGKTAAQISGRVTAAMKGIKADSDVTIKVDREGVTHVAVIKATSTNKKVKKVMERGGITRELVEARKTWIGVKSR